MLRAKSRQGKRKTSLDPASKPAPQQKNSNIIKTKMQSQSILNNHTKTTRILPRFGDKNGLPKEAPETRCSPSQSEEETKETSQEECEDYSRNWPPLRKNNPELEVYSLEIQQYVLMREQKYMVDHCYLRNHKLLSNKMRLYLVRHIFKICEKFELLRSTLFLAVQYMDLYFSRIYTFKDQIEMVSMAQACLFIAMKYEEIYPPDLSDWVDHRQKGEIVRLEAEVLKALDFQLAHYTLDHFMHFQLWQQTENGCDSQKVNERTLLLMDLSLFDLTMRQFKPSSLAKSIFQIGQMERKKPEEGQRAMLQNVEWMIERNKESIGWLLQHKYRHLSSSTFN